MNKTRFSQPDKNRPYRAGRHWTPNPLKSIEKWMNPEVVANIMQHPMNCTCESCYKGVSK